MNDRDFRERFAELRREDRVHAGEFSRFFHRARPRANSMGRSAWLTVAAVLTVMIAGVVISIPRFERRTNGNPETSITEWKSSTDFLLRTPGLDLLRTVPSIGEWPPASGIKVGRRRQPGRV